MALLLGTVLRRKDFFTQLKMNIHNRESFKKALTCPLYFFHFIFKVNKLLHSDDRLARYLQKRFLFIIPNLYTLKPHYFSCPPQRCSQNNHYRTFSGQQNQLQKNIWPIKFFFIKMSKIKCLLKQKVEKM